MGKGKNNTEEHFEKIIIELKDKMVTLKIKPFDTDINTDELCQIQYHNIMGEILTTSALLNRIGNLQAEMNSILADRKLNFELFYAQQYEKMRKALTQHIVTTRSDKYVPPTGTEIEQSIIRTLEYKVMRTNIIEVTKNKEYIDSLYWALKDKCDKVQRLTDKLRPDDFTKELIEGSINNVLIITSKKALEG